MPKYTCPKCGRENDRPACRSCDGTAAHLISGAQEGGKAHGDCFIATELYGAESAQVLVLRQFRDQSLMTNRLGTWLVHAYYRIGPHAIPVMRRSAVTRALLRAVVGSCAVAARRIPAPRA